MVISRVAEASHIGRQLAWDFILRHWKTLKARYGEGLNVLKRLLEDVTAGFTNEFQLQQVINFVKSYDHGHGKDHLAPLSQAIEVIKSNVAWISRNEKDLETWLTTYLSKVEEKEYINSDLYP